MAHPVSILPTQEDVAAFRAFVQDAPFVHTKEDVDALHALWLEDILGDNTPALRRALYALNPEKKKAQQRAYRARNRAEILEHLGGTCAACGATEHLEVDHVHGDGAEDRNAHGASCLLLFSFILSKPAGYFQLLCGGCHAKKTGEERRARKQR